MKTRTSLLVSLAAAVTVTSVASAASDAVQATWRIAFVSATNVKPPGTKPPGPVYRNRLFVIDSEGGGRRMLATDWFDSSAPSWSPDGRRIAFAKNPANGGSDSSAVFVIEADGRRQRNVTRSAARDVVASWSPDGRLIAFLRERRRGTTPRPGGYHELWVMKADGSGQRQLTDSTVPFMSTPRWSPDSRRIAVDRDGDVWVVDADGSGQRNLTTSATYDSQAAWSPDGRKIVFVSDRDGNGEIYAMDADGGRPQRLTNEAAGDFFPSWSPDGRRIAFVSTRAGNPEIYVMNADGTGQRRLTTTPASAAPAWSPDGKSIAFVGAPRGGKGNVELYLVNADGSRQRNLSRTSARELWFAWSPVRTR